MAKRIVLFGLLLAVCLGLTGCQTAQPAVAAEPPQQNAQTAQDQTEPEKMTPQEQKTDGNSAAKPQKEAPAPAPKAEAPQKSPVQTATTQPKDAKDRQNSEQKCTISINCAVIFDHLDKLDPDKKELLPKDGAILPETEVVLSPGESVFDVLLHAVRDHKIHMEFVSPPGYKSNYIEGINNLYEFDCGELSGWVYKVNGKVADCGSSLYSVKDGDKIEWCYTCDLGRDVGAAEGVTQR